LIALAKLDEEFPNGDYEYTYKGTYRVEGDPSRKYIFLPHSPDPTVQVFVEKDGVAKQKLYYRRSKKRIDGSKEFVYVPSKPNICGQKVKKTWKEVAPEDDPGVEILQC
jgi:hypothetical protein